jgi:AcrR family transcriptional regulator
MEIKLRILKEAGLMFAKFGIRSITMDSIANELGVSKRTLYETFEDKDDLVFQTIREGTKKHKAFCQNTIAKSENVIEAIFSVIKINNEIFGKINPLFLEDLKKYHSQIFRVLQEKGEIRDYKMTLKLLKRGVQEEIFSSDLNVEIINVFFHKIADSIHSDDLKEYSKEQLSKSVLLPYLYGIATDKGRVLIDNYFKDFN